MQFSVQSDYSDGRVRESYSSRDARVFPVMFLFARGSVLLKVKCNFCSDLHFFLIIQASKKLNIC